MNRYQRLAIGVTAALVLAQPAMSQEEEAPRQVLFSNVNIFDGRRR